MPSVRGASGCHGAGVPGHRVDDTDGHDVWRPSANQWELGRTQAGGHVTRHVNRVIDGSPEAHQILVRAPGEPSRRHEA